jgi:glycosyltransferase involved in cell wall biosynthesis
MARKHGTKICSRSIKAPDHKENCILKPIHVAMLIQRYAPLIGGAERQVGALAQELTRLGVQVSIVTRRYPGLTAFEEIDGVPVHRLPIPGPKAVASISYTLSALPLLARLRPDVLHAHEIFSPATTAVAAKRLLGIPVVLTAHRSGPLGDFERLHNKWMGARRLATFRREVRYFIPISQEIANEMENAGIPESQRWHVPNGVDTQRFSPLTPEARRAKRHALGLGDAPVAVFAGRLAPEKRVGQLVQVWNEVRAHVANATLLILGTGELDAELKAAAGEGIIFAGAQDDVVPFLQASDLFVLPSAAEGLSVAMLEAMACGLTALVTNIGGAPDVIRHGENGWLIPPDEPQTLSASLQTLLADASLRERLGAAARQTVQDDYSLQRVAHLLRELYEKVAKER